MANDRRAHAILARRAIEIVKTVASRGRDSRNHAATRFVCFLLGVGVTAEYQVHVDFL